ncbi:MAG: hybrid sensor histidine kinase/response regulator [Leptospiraceae bacterium]|nr:hybrid sensor histidine kinase/response regulator [Leptospiraceae bacterium]MCP5494772.1 hybrid sensor histidine kinase/response regulator [Leptospiraceae bacterium]
MTENKIVKILIVDDTPTNIEVLSTILTKNKYDVLAALDGFQAIETAVQFNPDLILLDVMMPHINGFNTCLKLKENPVTKNIPVIFLTARNEPEDIIKGFEVGAVDYVTKPFNSTELLARVKTHIELTESRKKIEQISGEREGLLHVLCHDLANPAGAILSMIKMVEADTVSMDKAKWLIRASSENILQVIKLVRKISALVENKYELKLEPINLKETLQTSISMLKNLIEKKEIQISLQIDDSIKILAERVSLVNSVVNNLLTNAIKFSYPKGRIEISAETLPNQKVQLIFQDHGIGMPQELLEIIFDPTKKTNRPGTNQEKGTGFGMPLVAKFVQSYNGRISVESIPEDADKINSGTKFLILFNTP